MLNTIKYINEFGLESLINEFNLIAKYSTKYPELVLLCYDQLKTPKNSITNETRGLIINTLDNSVVAYPFYRFGDYHDKAIIEGDIEVFEKIDGSLITLYYYKDKWNVATKTTPDAHGMIYIRESSICDLFLKVFGDDINKLSDSDKNKTFVFEFSHHNNNIEKMGNHFTNQGVAAKSVDDISLLMVRDLSDYYKEIDISEYKDKFKLVESHKMSLSDAITQVRNLDPIVTEGYVIKDAYNRRYKLKSPQFEVISELKINYDNTEERQEYIERENFRKVCEIVRTNNHRTFLDTAKYKSITPQYERLHSKYTKIISDTEAFINSVKHLTGKELNDSLKDTPRYLNNLTYLICNNKYHKKIEDFFYDMNIRTFEEIMR